MAGSGGGEKCKCMILADTAACASDTLDNSPRSSVSWAFQRGWSTLSSNT